MDFYRNKNQNSKKQKKEQDEKAATKSIFFFSKYKQTKNNFLKNKFTLLNLKWKASNNEEKQLDNVDFVSSKILDEVFEAFQKTQGQNSLLKENEIQLRLALEGKISHHLTLLKNTAYSRGFNSHLN